MHSSPSTFLHGGKGPSTFTHNPWEQARASTKFKIAQLLTKELAGVSALQAPLQRQPKNAGTSTIFYIFPLFLPN